MIMNNIISPNEFLKKTNEEMYEIYKNVSIENQYLKLKLYGIKSNYNDNNDIINISEEIDRLSKENVILKEKIEQQNIRITKLEKDVIELKSRDEPITVREGMNALEQHIMLEIVGTKRKMRGYYGALNLFNDNKYEESCKKYLKDNNITEDHINLMVSLKKEGNISAHENRPVIKRSEWDNLVVSMLDDPNDIHDVNMVKDLLHLAEKYNPIECKSDDWIIKKP
jgi:hypothetical protein